MAVTFHKMHGLGNDFMLLDVREQAFTINTQLARQLADRHTGIGCDQILVLRKPTSEKQDACFEVWNSDGSRAEQCGNGMRCIGLYLHMHSVTPSDRFLLGGPAGTVEIEYLGNDQVRVNMGRPVFEHDRIPVSAEPVKGWYRLDIDGQTFSLGAASMGNPHALLIVNDIGTTDVARLGAAISSHSVFPQGCNAGFAQIQNRGNIRLRVFERGAAETLACGSGACAAVSILRNANLVDQIVNVTQTGGDLILEWPGGNHPVIMTGPATHVFKGKLT